MVDTKVNIVIGLGYGDEGKGLTTDYLCSKAINNSLVIRFNGGHQAGHTVYLRNGERHVFSCFGSGTLRGIPTYWSKYCTVSPQDIIQEYEKLGSPSKLFIDPLSPITTHYDVLYNRVVEDKRGGKRYGSCGVGFGATIDRHNNTAIQFFYEDLKFPQKVNKLLGTIRDYYRKKLTDELNEDFESYNHDAEDSFFKEYVNSLMKLDFTGKINMAEEKEIFSKLYQWKTLIFEGAQGILLDQNFGNRPYVTKSNTTSQNAISILERNFDIPRSMINVYYVTRIYSTRHGGGEFEETTLDFIKTNHNETNVYNDYQGEFKTGLLNIDSLNYAIGKDDNFSSGCNKHLMITCVDQLKSSITKCYINGKAEVISYHDIPKLINIKFSSITFSLSQHSDSGFESLI